MRVQHIGACQRTLLPFSFSSEESQSLKLTKVNKIHWAKTYRIKYQAVESNMGSVCFQQELTSSWRGSPGARHPWTGDSPACRVG